MTRTKFILPKYPITTELPDELEPGELPVEPDEGPAPTHIPDDPEHDRVMDPGERWAWQTQQIRRPTEIARYL